MKRKSKIVPEKLACYGWGIINGNFEIMLNNIWYKDKQSVEEILEEFGVPIHRNVWLSRRNKINTMSQIFSVVREMYKRRETWLNEK